ncbi:hypothetical protein [Vibrio phage VCPH]|nr:hypothetical protein [Vibrio phage VCPH]
MATHRTSIVSALVNLIETTLDGSDTDKYYTNLWGNVSDKILHFDEVNDFPFVSVAKGTETTEYLPGMFRWNFLNLYIRVYVRGADDYDEQLENLITDLKTLIDLHESFPYNVTMPSGTNNPHEVTEVTILGVDTDEGLLAPDAFGEIQLRVRYEDCNALLR